MPRPTTAPEPTPWWSRESACGDARSWRSPERRLLRASPPGWRRFRPPSELVTRPLTPLLPALGAPGIATVCRFASSRGGPAPSRSRQRPRLVLDRDAFHRRVLPPPARSTRLGAFASVRALRVGSRRAAACVALHVLVAFATATGFRRFFARCATPSLDGAAGGLDPCVFRPGPCAARRLLQSTATCEHDHAIAPTPAGESASTRVRLRAPRAVAPGCALALPIRR